MTKKRTHMFPDESDRIKAELGDSYGLCPICCSDWVIKGTTAGEEYGVCPRCYAKAKTYAAEAMAADLRCKREYDTARQHLRRARQAAGVKAAHSSRYEVDFEAAYEAGAL